MIFGAVGGPKWDSVAYDVRPEAGLLRLRKELGLFANIRPAICYPALAESSSLKREVVDGLDIVILRELTGGVYFGEPKTITDLGNGQKPPISSDSGLEPNRGRARPIDEAALPAAHAKKRNKTMRTFLLASLAAASVIFTLVTVVSIPTVEANAAPCPRSPCWAR